MKEWMNTCEWVSIAGQGIQQGQYRIKKALSITWGDQYFKDLINNQVVSEMLYFILIGESILNPLIG